MENEQNKNDINKENNNLNKREVWNCTKGKGETSGINKKEREYRNRLVRLGANWKRKIINKKC